MNLPMFDISNISPGMIIDVVGRKFTGKTYLIKNILHVLQTKYDIDLVIIICPDFYLSRDGNWHNSRKQSYGSIYGNIEKYYSIQNFLCAEMIKYTSKTILVLDGSLDPRLNNNTKILQLIANNIFHNVIIASELHNHINIKNDIPQVNY